MQFPGLLTHNEYLIKFQHIPTGQTVEFPGWVTQFDDQYTSVWNQTPTYGRMDPLATFQRTSRVISLGFDVVAANVVEARVNLDKISKFIRFLYPTYTGNERELQNTLSGGPLLGFKWTNLISSKGTALQGMLYGYTNGFTYSPNVADGGFLTDPGVATPGQTAASIARAAPPITDPKAGENEEITKTIKAAHGAQRNAVSSFIPKTVSLSLQFNVLHTHLMGWSDGTFGGGDSTSLQFPYMPNAPINPASGVAPGDAIVAVGAMGLETDGTNDSVRNLAPEVDAQQSKALE